MRKMQSNNTSGFPGVTFDKARGLWRVRYTWHGVRKSYPRMFKDQQAAIDAATALREAIDAKLREHQRQDDTEPDSECQAA